jgi:predicted NBD/HSP70 family sugar kinase
VVVEVLHPAGTVVTRSVRPVTRRATTNLVSEALAGAAREALGARRAQVAAVSAADPVDKVTGELVHLPDAPFLLGAMSPPTTLEPFVDGSVSVDNDVNWAAGAERAARADGGSDDFVYLYLGEGLGCAVVSDGQVRRGHRGLAGEIAHVTVPGPDGGAMPLIALFGRLGLRHPSSTAIDVDRLLAALAAREGADLGRILAAAVAAALDAAVAFADPAFVVAGGPWASAPQFAQQLGEAVARRPRPVRLESPRLGADAPLHGARAAAVEELRRRIVARSRSSR